MLFSAKKTEVDNEITDSDVIILWSNYTKIEVEIMTLNGHVYEHCWAFSNYILQLGLCIGQNDRYSIYHMISKVSIENEWKWIKNGNSICFMFCIYFPLPTLIVQV